MEKDDACIVSTGIYMKLNRNCATNSNMPKTTFPVFVGNYARSSHWFESGFTEFIGLTITSSIGVGRLLLYGAFNSWLFADALRIGEKKGKK